MIELGSRVYMHGRHHTVTDQRERVNRDGEHLRQVLLVPDATSNAKSPHHWIDEWRVQRYAFSIKPPSDQVSRSTHDRAPAGVLRGGDRERPPAVGREVPGDLTEREAIVPTATTRRSRSRSGKSAATPKQATRAAAPKTDAKSEAKPEKGTEILAALLKGLENAIGDFDRKPNKSGTYTRLLIGGKAFAYLFPPRGSALAVKVPKQLLGIAGDLPNDHGFKVTAWGLTKSLKAAAEVPVTVKSLAVAAKAARPAPAPAATAAAEAK